MGGFYEWSLAADNNASADSTLGWAEGMAAAAVNNNIRQTMARLRAFSDALGGAIVTGGTGNAFTATTDTGLTTLRGGVCIVVRADRANSGNATLNVDGTGALPWLDMDGAQITSGSIKLDSFYPAYYHPSSNTWRSFILALSGLANIGVQRAFLAGLTLSNTGGVASNSMTIAAGAAAADASPYTVMTLGSAFAKTLTTFAAGTGNGGLDTGAVANNTWYSVYLIATAAGVTDVLFSLSATAPTMPTGYTLKRRIGAMRTNTGAGTWTLFSQSGDMFLWKTSITDLAGTATTTAAAVALSVPRIAGLEALLRAYAFGSSALQYVTVWSPDETDQASNYTSFIDIAASTSPGASVNIRRRVNASAQVRYGASGSASLYLHTYGWVDTRGRLD